MITVVDWQGQVRDEAYLKARYGSYVIQEAAPGDGPFYQITKLIERADDGNMPAGNVPAETTTLIGRVVDGNGDPLGLVRLAWYWPDAPEDSGAGPVGGVLPGMVPNRCISELSNANGDAGFGMGSGAYYWPTQGQIGPHALWVHGVRSDLLLGCGMVAMTNHYHFDVEFTRIDQEVPPDNNWATLFKQMKYINNKLARIIALMEGK